MLDLFLEIGQTLKNNKLRTALTGIAVAWGIFMLIVLLGMGRGVINSFNGRVNDQGTNAINVWGGRTTVPYKGYKEGRWIRLREDDLATVENENRNFVESATSSVSGSGTISTPDNYISNGYSGVYPRELKDRGYKMLSGRFINDRDLDEKRKVMVLSKENADLLFPNGKEAVGGRVTCSGLSFTVIGVYTANWGRESYIPFTTAMMVQGNEGYIDRISVNLKNVETMEDGENAESQVRNTLAAVHEFDKDDSSGVWIWNKFTQHLQMSSAMNILNMTIWIIGILTMLTGIVGVSNIMFVSVKERTHEIGIRRAIGARPKNILVQILTESVSITALFGYIGIFFGILVTELLKKVFENSDAITNPTVDISIAIEVTVLLIVAGAMAGLFPALKALKVKPVEALRDE